MKKFKKLSRNELKSLTGGLKNPNDGGIGGTGNSCEYCVMCEILPDSKIYERRCSVNVEGDCEKAKELAQYLC